MGKKRSVAEIEHFFPLGLNRKKHDLKVCYRARNHSGEKEKLLMVMIYCGKEFS